MDKPKLVIRVRRLQVAERMLPSWLFPFVYADDRVEVGTVEFRIGDEAHVVVLPKGG